MVLKVEKPVNCTLVGDAMIGKSTLVQAFLDQQLPRTPYVATVLETYEGRLAVDGHQHNLSILDNAGQHDYGSMRSCSYKDNEALVLCYSVVDRDSFESIKDFWIPEVTHSMRRRKPIILVATQTDLRHEKADDVTAKEGEQLATEIGAETFIECTATDKDSVNHVFETMTMSGLRYRKRKHNLVNRIFGK